MAVAHDRMEIRLIADEKEVIEAAAQARGLTTSAYSRAVLLGASKQVLLDLQKANAILLSRDESKRFLKALSASFIPNAKLAKVMKRAKSA